jgi:hypothetical protein
VPQLDRISGRTGRKKGEHSAIFEDIKFLLAHEFQQAYQQEMGKRLATHDDIENVRTDVRMVTQETETIKAQIGNDLWLRQTVWNHKREAYLNTIRFSRALGNALIAWRSMRMVLDQARQENQPAASLAKADNETTAKVTAYFESYTRLADVLIEAEMFLDGAAVQLFSEYRAYDLTRDILVSNTEPVEKSKQLSQFLSHWTDRLIDVAKQDLGVKSVE